MMNKLTQKITIGLSTAAILLSTSVFPAAADNDHNNNRFGPYQSTSPDGGSCGQPWANDTFNRVFTVSQNNKKNNQENNDKGDNNVQNDNKTTTPATFYVREDYQDGRFITTGPVSPGACETTDTNHGSAVLPNIPGKFEGYIQMTVSNGTYNPNGCNTNPNPCTTTAGFVTAVFGPTATYTTDKFDFQYQSNDSRLKFKHWRDSGTATTEVFKGDIATQ